MSARPMPKSRAKLDRWAATADLTRRAMALAKREGIPLIEALARVAKEERC